MRGSSPRSSLRSTHRAWSSRGSSEQAGNALPDGREDPLLRRTNQDQPPILTGARRTIRGRRRAAVRGGNSTRCARARRYRARDLRTRLASESAELASRPECGSARARFGKPHAAADAFSALLSRYPTLPLLHQNLGAALLAQGDPERQGAQLLRAHAGIPARSALGLALADAEMALGNGSIARSLLEALLRDEPGLHEAMTRLARVSEALGDSGGALKWSERAARCNPVSRGFRARLERATGQAPSRSGREVLQRAERLHPEMAHQRCPG